MDSAACMICGLGGHSVNRCTELVDPLRDGFYRGGGGGGVGVKVTVTVVATVMMNRC